MKDKRTEYQKQWRLNNPDKYKQFIRKDWEKLKNTPERLQKKKEYAIKFNKEHRVYNAEVAKTRKDKYKEELHDEYIKKLLLHRSYGLISAKDIQTDLINLKRKQLILTRKFNNHE
jgi:Fe2+ transport system protein B